MSKNVVVVGCQWGDEGKGKIVDILAEKADIIARFQGGANAGHTILAGGKKFILHLVPSGIIHPGKIGYIGNGVVLDPFALLHELEWLNGEGINTEKRIFISPATNLVLPYHELIDCIDEKKRGGDGIGTTLRGIGPAYRDKIDRCGIRLCDLFNPDRLKKKLELQPKIKSEYFIGSNDDRSNIEKILNDLMRIAPSLHPLMADISLRLLQHQKEGRSILYEGAQGAMLDIDMGTYPFATSSNTIAGGALTGLGIGPKMIDEVIGVIKAYATRVGAGPFPTELIDETGEQLRSYGGEFGATTGRPRRTGWLDMVILRYACRINGIEKIAITKLDILDHFEKIKVCTGYRLNGQTISEVPLDLSDLWQVQPIYEELDGWLSTTSGMTGYQSLPQKAKDYLQFITDDLNVKICLISTGAKREETIVIK
ncbi:MAG: adenylosuccinate synthase [candidate division Zixibacteria bacterium]|nr:adenylosuccinate synthase [candidate division Zixibacteria bacterium]